MSYRCPVCMNSISNKSRVCSNCGYDESKDYEKYLVLGSIAEDTVPTSELRLRMSGRYVLREELEQEQEKNKALRKEIRNLQHELKYEQKKNEELLLEKHSIIQEQKNKTQKLEERVAGLEKLLQAKEKLLENQKVYIQEVLASRNELEVSLAKMEEKSKARNASHSDGSAKAKAEDKAALAAARQSLYAVLKQIKEAKDAEAVKAAAEAKATAAIKAAAEAKATAAIKAAAEAKAAAAIKAAAEAKATAAIKAAAEAKAVTAVKGTDTKAQNTSGSNAKTSESQVKKTASTEINAAVINRLSRIKPGDLLQLGTYKREPITWIITEKKDTKLLLLSQYAIEQMEFAQDFCKGWEKSTVRSWLNKDFYNKAFTQDEKNIICQEKIENLVYNRGEYVPANPTQDKVFLLSQEQAKALQGKSTKQLLQCKPAAHAIAPGQEYADYCKWWLRTPSAISDSILIVSDKGNFAKYGSWGREKCGARPAIWVDAAKMNEKTLPKTLPNLYEQQEKMPHRKVDIKKGSTISWGTYKGLPITWRALSVSSSENIAYLISENALDTRSFHNSSEAVSWKNSSLRKWLNEDFYQEAFTKEEQWQIASDLGDRVSLLSNDDAKKYFPKDKDRQCKKAPNMAKNVWTLKSDADWWLKGPDKLRKEADYVVNNGKIFANYQKATDDRVCVRPTIVLKLES